MYINFICLQRNVQLLLVLLLVLLLFVLLLVDVVSVTLKYILLHTECY